MPLKTDSLQTNFITDRIRNQQNAGEGSSFAPKMRNGIRIPLVTNVKILKTESYTGGTQFTVSFLEANDDASIKISHYVINVQGVDSGNKGLSMTPVVTQQSPAVIKVNTAVATPAIISVQTVLTNGQSSTIEASPTVVGNTIAPSISASDIPSTTLAALNLVLGYSNLTTANGVTYVSGTTGTITEDPTNFSYDSSNKRLGLLTNSPKSTVDILGSLGLLLSSQSISFTAGNAVVYICDATAGNITVTLPAAASFTNRLYYFKKKDSSVNTVIVGSSFTLHFQNESILIISDGTNWINLIHSVL